MTREKLLTRPINNWLNIGLGSMAFVYVIYAVSSGLWSEIGGLIGIGIVGVIY